MSKISYPFAAIPNHIVRGGHGITNIAVLAVLLSHGRSTASAQTLASELKCSRKTIFAGLKYWREYGSELGVNIHEVEGREGCTNIIEISIDRAEEPVPKGERVKYQTRTQRGTRGVPKGEHLPVPKGEHKEEYIKKITEEYRDLVPSEPVKDNQTEKNDLFTGPTHLPDEPVQEEADIVVPPPDSVNQVFKVFYDSINPQVNYGNRTHRAAAQSLVDRYGLEEVLAFTKMACDLQGREYCPTITNPLQLKDKLSQLFIYLKRESAPKKGAIQSL